jgi:serine/threonine-protein kinase RsbW
MDSEILLGLPARPENVAVVRQALAGLADALRVDPALAADMKIAITEACTNAVLHAYDEEGGPLEVLFRSDPKRLTVSVRDRGPGFKPLPAADDENPLGFGLALIASLADAFAIQGSPHGTEVQMSFDLNGESDAAAPVAMAGQLATDAPPPPADGVVLRVPAGDLAQPVLGRVVSLLAARVDFSIDRLSDAQIVSDALALHAPSHALDGHVAVRIDERERCIELRVGPLEPGGGQRLVASTDLPGVGVLIPQLASEYEVEPHADKQGEVLRVRLAESH